MPPGYEDNTLTAEVYDLVPAYINRPDKEFYLQVAESVNGSILELGCGTGRILLPLAEQGCRITGLDISESMLAWCRHKLNSTTFSSIDHVRLVQGDMTEFRLDDTFSLTIIPCHAFQHLISPEDQESCLNAVNRHLAQNGMLIFDVINVDIEKINDPASASETIESEEYELSDGSRVRRAYRTAGFHPARQFNDIQFIYYLTASNGDTRRIVHTFQYRYFFRHEIEHLLEHCGFRVVEIYGDFDRSPLIGDSPEMIFVAEKCCEF